MSAKRRSLFALLLSLLFVPACQRANQANTLQLYCYLHDGKGINIIPHHPIHYRTREIGHVEKLELSLDAGRKGDIKFIIFMDPTQYNAIQKPVFLCTINPVSGATSLEVIQAAEMPTNMNNITILELP